MVGKESTHQIYSIIFCGCISSARIGDALPITEFRVTNSKTYLVHIVNQAEEYRTGDWSKLKWAHRSTLSSHSRAPQIIMWDY